MTDWVARVGSNGQVVIPKRLRIQLGIEPGDEVADGAVLVEPVRERPDLKGTLRDLEEPVASRSCGTPTRASCTAAPYERRGCSHVGTSVAWPESGSIETMRSSAVATNVASGLVKSTSHVKLVRPAFT